MLKVYLAIGLLLAVTTSSFWAGYQVASGKEAKREVKIITDSVENHNEDLISIEKHTSEIAKIQERYEEELAKIPLIQPSSNARIDDFADLWNKAIATSNSMRVEDTWLTVQ